MHNRHFITKGSGLLIKPLPARWALYRGGARCCAVVGFYQRGRLVLASYIVLN